MAKISKPTIAFLTTHWLNIDENIRAGLAPGGVPSVTKIWEKMLQRGYNVHVLISCQPEPGWPHTTVELGGVTFHWVRQPLPRLSMWLHDRGLIGLIKPLWFLTQCKMLWRIFRLRIRPDLVYCMRPTFVWLGYFWSRLVGAKSVLRLYGTPVYAIWFEEHNWVQRIATLGTWLAMKVPVDRLIITNDGSRGDVVAEWAGVDESRLRFWRNGVDKTLHLPDFDRNSFKKALGLPAESPLLMTLGRLTEVNRIDRAIDAMPRIRESIPDVRLMIVGGGELESCLRDRAARRGVADAVLFTGPVAHEDIRPYLNACDVFIQANDRTNLRSTLIEAITAGCCVITRDVGGTTEVAHHGQTAIVLSPGEPEQIADEAVRLLRSPEERRMLSERARRFAVETFQTWGERMDMEADELDTLVGGGSFPRRVRMTSA